MIKLNNKNITYVALADSNNSLKAPKEIWYADSPNSVKLVYRRKDALIEGEDYEKYHWLKGDGSAYIDTQIIYLDGVIDLVAAVEGDGIKLGRERLNSSSDYYSRFAIRIDSSNGLVHVFSSEMVSAYITQPLVLQIDIQNDSLTINGQLKSLDFIPNVEANTIYLFAINRFNNPVISSQSIVKISKFSISSKINLIPCKLLKPVPKWLDANGIRRQVGECGMIDLVSGKFYGNVNSVGTFTVENYYERKNYLKCSDGSYMLYQNFDATSNIVNGNWVKFGTTEYLGEEYFLYGLIRTGWLCACYISENKLLLCNHIVGESYTALWKYDLSTLNSHDNVAIQLKTEQVSSPTKYVSRSSIVFSDNYTLAPQNDNWFYNTVWGNTVCNLKISTPNGYILSDCNITQNNNNVISSLIPCTLTMDLPASMDANNIARTKGTSGMWDLVSDKFYGNVANSGTFKAVNLAEGVDYEVHQYLIGDGTAYATATVNIYRDTVNTLIIPTTTVANTIMYATMSTKLGDTTNYAELSAFITASKSFTVRHTVRVNNQPDSVALVVPNDYVDKTYTIKTTRSGTNYVYYLNGSQVAVSNHGQYVEADTNVTPQIYANGCKLGYFSTSGSNEVNLIPVKLLKSIPSKYDANGIARQAGECGMYDTVNDVFYGNVANSGTFTVSND